MAFRDLKKTIDLKLCMGCGACQLICPKDMIVMGNGGIPKIKEYANEKHCENCIDCISACPGINPETYNSEQYLFHRQRNQDERWLGIYSTVISGLSTNKKILERSLGGGSTTTILKVAMEYLKLDCVIVLGRDPCHPWIAKPKVCCDPNELINYSQSTYQMCQYITILKNLVSEKNPKKMGIVALPCQVQALRKIQRINNPIGRLIKDQVVFIAEIACNSNTTSRGTETLIKDIMKVPLDSIQEVRYRDGSYPGNFTVYMNDGGIKTVPTGQAFRHFQKYKNFRCLSCGDWMSGLSDISICDGDTSFSNFNKPEKEHSLRYNVIFARTTIGINVLNWAIKNKALNVWDNSDKIEEINAGLQRKKKRRKSYEYLKPLIPEGPIFCEGKKHNVVKRSP